MRSIFPLRCLEVVRNGEVVARAEANGGRQAGISEEVRIDGNSWLACRAFGADYHLDEWGRRVFAHTSPVYVACGGDWRMTDAEGIRYLWTLVEGARDYVRHTAVRRTDQLTTHDHGEADHLAWLERPFAEACARWTRAAMSNNGYLYIIDRKKDLIISGGQNIVSKGIEDALYESRGCLKRPRSAFPAPSGRASTRVRVVRRRARVRGR